MVNVNKYVVKRKQYKTCPSKEGVSLLWPISTKLGSPKTTYKLLITCRLNLKHFSHRIQAGFKLGTFRPQAIRSAIWVFLFVNYWGSHNSVPIAPKFWLPWQGLRQGCGAATASPQSSSSAIHEHEDCEFENCVGNAIHERNPWTRGLRSSRIASATFGHETDSSGMSYSNSFHSHRKFFQILN